jgi:hypothetical protein
MLHSLMKVELLDLIDGAHIYLETELFVCYQVSAGELTNGVINAAFMLLFKDLIRLFACYNDGIINLLGRL